MLTTICVLAGVTTAAALVTGARVMGLRRMVKHSTKVDVAFTAGAGFLLAGTLTGLATGILAGLCMALVLSLLKLLYRAVDRLSAGVQAVKDEFTADGVWEYNQDVYTRGMNV